MAADGFPAVPTMGDDMAEQSACGLWQVLDDFLDAHPDEAVRLALDLERLLDRRLSDAERRSLVSGPRAPVGMRASA